MKQKLYDKIVNWLTKGQTEIPLFYITFDRRKYRKDGAEGICLCKHHPVFSEDKELMEIIKSVIDHIRNNYNMDEI